MDDLLDSLRVKGRVRNAVDGRFYVSVRHREENLTFSTPPLSDMLMEAVDMWCEENCVGAYDPYGGSTMVFEQQEDAVLFMLRLIR